MPKWPCRYIIWLSYLVYRCSINIYNFFSNCGCYTDEQTKVIRSYDIFSPNVYFAWVAHFGASKEEGALCHAHIRAHNTILQHKEVLLIGKNHLLSKLTTITTDFFVLLTVPSLDGMSKNFTCSLHCIQVLGKFLGINGQDPSDSKSNHLHVNIFHFCFHSFETDSTNSSKMISKFPKVLNFNRLFLKLNRFICN